MTACPCRTHASANVHEIGISFFLVLLRIWVSLSTFVGGGGEGITRVAVGRLAGHEILILRSARTLNVSATTQGISSDLISELKNSSAQRWHGTDLARLQGEARTNEILHDPRTTYNMQGSAESEVYGYCCFPALPPAAAPAARAHMFLVDWKEREEVQNLEVLTCGQHTGWAQQEGLSHLQPSRPCHPSIPLS